MISMRDFRPAKELALRYGVKSLAHGAPGSGKTPIIKTAPRPLILGIEPGFLSMRDSNIPVYPATTPKAIDDFFEWLTKSNERRNYDTLCVDSGSEMATVSLNEKLATKTAGGNDAHGLKAYGDMAKFVMPHMRTMFFLEQMHVYIICKQGLTENGKYVPLFPGQQLNSDIPHLYDLILAVGYYNVPGVGMTKAFKTSGQNDVLARDRSGMLNEYEPCDLTALFAKVMS